MVSSHASTGESGLGVGSTLFPFECPDAENGFGQLLFARAQETGHTVGDELGCGPERRCDDGRPARQGFDHYHAEGLGPGDRVDQTRGAAEQGEFVGATDLAYIGDVAPQQWRDTLVEVLVLGWF